MFFINNVEESDFFDKGKLCLSLDNLSVDTMYQNVVKNSFSLFVAEFNKQ